MKYKLPEDKIGEKSTCLRMSGNNMLCFKGSKAKFSVTVTMKEPIVL